MTNTEIKKELYKQKPPAVLLYVRKGVAYYCANLEQGQVNFQIPVDDMGDADFTAYMDAKLLARWLV